ncbi:MAG TPA: SAM-dependent methyltransferase [Acidimicrobiales bacterium]|nr:SAM-dependent methyltransferase [Acidimicrobiales bacterium]
MTGSGGGRAIGDEWPAEIDTSVAHPARVYDYYLGGVTNFEVDRVAAEHAAAVHPGGLETVRAGVRSNRAFLVRAVQWLAGEAGVRQFLDIGSGIPSSDDVHATAQRTAPDCRIVYVDNDPIVLAHAHELSSTPEGAVESIQGDLRDPDSILERASATLDLRRPVAVMLVGILHFFPPADDPYGIVRRLLAAVPSGSYLVVGHLASDIHAEEMAEVARRFTEMTNERWVLRSNAEVARFFDGLHLVEPGVVQIDQWRPLDGPEPVLPPEGRVNPLHVGVARKP